MRDNRVVLQIDGELKNINRDIQSLEKRLTDTGHIGKKAVGVINKSLGALGSAAVAAAGAAGLGYLVKRQLDLADATAKTSKRIGITTDALQKYRFIAERTGVEQSQLDKGLEAFSKRLGEARAGTGSLNTMLNKMGDEFRSQVIRAQSTDQALQLVMERMRGLEQQSDRAALAAAAFSRTAGVAMSTMADEIKPLTQRFEDLGLAVDKDLLQHAEAANDAITDLSHVLDVQLKNAVLILAPHIANLGTKLADVASATGDVIKKVKELDRLAEVAAHAERLQAAMSSPREIPGWLQLLDDWMQGGNPMAEFGMLPGREIPLLSKLEEIAKLQESIIEAGAWEMYASSIDGSTASVEGLGAAAKEVGIDFDALGKQIDDAFDDAKKSQEAAIKEGERLNEQTLKLTENYVNMGDELEEALGDPDKYFGPMQDESEETAKKLVRDTEKATSEMDRLWETFLDNTQSAFADAFYDMMDDGIDDWSDFTDRIGDMFKRMLAEMAAYAVMNPIQVSLSGLMGGQGGGSNIPGGGSLLSGLGNKAGMWLSGGGETSLWGGIGASAFGSPTFAAGTEAAALEAYAGTTTATSAPAWWGTLGSGLAAGGIAAMSYGPLAEATGMPAGKHSAALAGGLATIGMMAGGPIGAVAGGLIGGLFGSGSKTPVKRDLRLEISGDDANAFSWIRRAPSMGQTYLDWQEAGPPTGGGTMGDIGRQQWRARESGQEGFIDVQTGRFVTVENLDPSRQYFSENWTDKTRALEKQVNQWLDAAVKPIDTVIDTYEKYTDTVVNVPDFEMSAQVRGRNTNELIQDMLSTTEKELKAWTKDVTAAMGFETAEELTAYMAYLEQLAKNSGQQFIGGIRAALKADEGLDTWKVFSDTIEQSMYDSVLNGVINAFMESEMIKSALTPTMLAINEALDSAMSESGAFAADLFWNQVDPALDAMDAAIKGMRPALDAIEGVSDKLTGKATDNQVAEAGLQLMGVTGGVSQYLPTGYSGSGSPMPLSYWEEHGYQHGTGMEGLPQTGPYWGHEGEIVLNPQESDAVRRGGGSLRDVNLNIQISALDARNFRQVVKRDLVPQFIEVLETNGEYRTKTQFVLDRG